MLRTLLFAVLAAAAAAQVVVDIDAGSSSDDDALVSGPSVKYSVGTTNVSGTDEDERYSSHRCGSGGGAFSYDLPLDDGQYLVTLGFAEVWNPGCGAGMRVFSVFADAVEVVSDLDVFAAVGCNAAHVETFPVNVCGGSLQLSFDQNGGTADPMVSSIVVSSTDSGTNMTASPCTSKKRPTMESMDITESELLAARDAWGVGLVKISKAYDEEGISAAHCIANEVLDSAYGYQMGPVMFKPTLASGEQTFRPTKKGALSYFIANDPDYPLDGGFALKSWRNVETETSASFIEEDVAMWMGWMTFTDVDGHVTKVDKSFGYKKDAEGVLRIVLHHSSLPYQPAAASDITDEEMAAAREAWGVGLIKISEAYDNSGIDAARPIAEEVLNGAYGYDMGPVMFKPTLASGEQTFRPTKRGALSYFIAHDEKYPLDGGFALKSWRKVTTTTSESFIEEDVAMWMGWMTFTDVNGSVTQVDKSFGYKKDADGVMRIVLHHSSLPYQPAGAEDITEEDMAAAREAWGVGLVKISEAYDNSGIDEAKKLAEEVLDAAYGYQMGPVMFKPTLASGEQTFRPTKRGALSYFVAHDDKYPLDGGFALKSWRKVTTTTSASFIEEDVAMWMGWMTFTDVNGSVTQVDKSFGYKKDADGVMRIVLHHSSLPYQPAGAEDITEEDMAAAREAWGVGLVKISEAYDNSGIDEAKKLAEEVLDAAYGYQMGPVMFKPTLASGEQTFRPTKRGALSYFVAHDDKYPLDGGFALKSWRKVTTTTSASFIEDDVSMWMGWMTFTDVNGSVTQVDKSFGYKKDADGVMRIVLHHSSLPFEP